MFLLLSIEERLPEIGLAGWVEHVENSAKIIHTAEELSFISKKHKNNRERGA
jgi:hypothetical protein